MDALKSLILSLAVVDRRLTVAEAVALTRLGIFDKRHYGMLTLTSKCVIVVGLSAVVFVLFEPLIKC